MGQLFRFWQTTSASASFPLDGHQKRCEKTSLFRELNFLWAFQARLKRLIMIVWNKPYWRDMDLPIRSWELNTINAVASKGLNRTNQIQVWKIYSKSDGNCLLGLRRNNFRRFPWRIKNITGIYYEDVLRKFKAAVIKKRPKKLHEKDWKVAQGHLVPSWQWTCSLFKSCKSCLKRISLRNFTTITLQPWFCPIRHFFISQAEKTAQRNTISDHWWC